MREMMDHMQERQAIARRVTAALRHSSGRAAFGLAECEETNILVALPTDTCAEVFRRAEKAGRPVRVVMPDADGLHVATIRAVPTGTAGQESDTPLHPDAQISMLLDYLNEHRPGLPTVCHISVPGGVLECDSQTGPVMIPA